MWGAYVCECVDGPALVTQNHDSHYRSQTLLPLHSFVISSEQKSSIRSEVWVCWAYISKQVCFYCEFAK